MVEPVKGTVTSLSSIIPAEEALKASIRVQDNIAARQKELDQLQEFVSDNTSLVNLVQRLPDELHHEIMVPFGKAAFFPGCLIHTNEFLVLLGEGYYAERTSKQTTEILKRRGKVLDSQVESLKAVMQDLRAEASFFDATAAEAAEGLVEIREEYIEESSSEMDSKTGSSNSDHHPGFPEHDKMEVLDEDEEYARLLSRIDELEKEELAAESLRELDENEEGAPTMPRMDELEIEKLLEKISEHDEDGQAEADSGHSINQQSPSHKHKNVMFEGLDQRPVSEGGKSVAPIEFGSSEKAVILPEVKENVQATSTSKNEAFTGTIVERSPSVEKNPMEQSTTSKASKTVSRFKMQRR